MRALLSLLVLVLLGVAIPACTPAPPPHDAAVDAPSIPVEVWITAASGERLTPREGVAFVAAGTLDPSLPRFAVDENVEHQTMIGKCVGSPWEALRYRGEAPLRSGTSQSEHSGC